MITFLLAFRKRCLLHFSWLPPGRWELARDIKENVNFRLPRREKETLSRIAAEEGQPVGELIRQAVQDWLAARERSEWESEARRASLALAEEAGTADTPEAKEVGALEAHLEEFAGEWTWEDE